MIKLNSRNIFLIDGLGALASFSLTGLILPIFSEELGISKQVLHSLAIFPLVYSIYSLSCYKFVEVIKSWMLLAVILANLLYCLISLFLVLNLSGITIWGQSLLAYEVLVILFVVAVEVPIYRKMGIK